MVDKRIVLFVDWAVLTYKITKSKRVFKKLINSFPNVDQNYLNNWIRVYEKLEKTKQKMLEDLSKEAGEDE